MKTEYFPIEPRSLGTMDCESFGSIFCRTTMAHSVSVYVLLKHLSLWWQRESGQPLPPAPSLRFFFCPAGRSIEAFAEALAVG
jgi:hypothetical protein